MHRSGNRRPALGRGLALVAGLVLASLVAGCGSPGDSTPPPTPTPKPVPAFHHIYLIVLENKGYGELVGSKQAPFFNSLIAKYGLATNYDAVDHPSQPNYVALFSGSTQGVTSDGTYELKGRNLFDQLQARGKTWRVFAQDYPGNCYTGDVAAGPSEGFGAAGNYARKHNPAISFTDVRTNPARCANIQNLAGFDPAAANFEYIIPNDCNNMHSCPIASGDAFLAAIVPRITSSPAFADSVLFITADEGPFSTPGGGRVPTIVVSPLTPAGFRSATPHDHYSLLRTIENSWGLGCLANSCEANAMGEFFR